MKCYSVWHFTEVFLSRFFSHILISSFLNSNQQLNNNEIWRSFALWFLFSFSCFVRGLLKNFFSFLVCTVQLSKWKEKETKVKNSWKISSFLWILNWQFLRALKLHCIEVLTFFFSFQHDMRLQWHLFASFGLLALQRPSKNAHQLDWSEGNYGNFIFIL